MTTVAEEEQWHQQAAQQAVERFVKRFDESYRVLAYHAALPLVLTPELVNYLRNQFLRNENVPWVAEVDLLLSDLCSQVGYELYAMDTHIRGYLLEQMKQDPRFGKPRMQQVAQVLINYVKYLSHLHPGRKQKELEAQRWAAMVYLGDEQCKQAAREIAQGLIETSSGTDSENLTESGMRAELARLTRITAELSPQLQQEPTLVEYARLIQRVLRQPDTVTPAELNPYQLDDLELRVPDWLLPETLTNTVSVSGQTVTEVEGLPPLQTFQCKVLTIGLRTGKEISSEIDLEPFDFEVATIQVKDPIQTAEEAVFGSTGPSFTDRQRSILRGALDNQTYQEIAHSLGYSSKYLQSVGSKLWKLLTEALGQKVTKTNLKSVLNAGLTIHRHQQQADGFTEDLGNGVELEMVAIPEGSFIMGSPETEEGHTNDESPQHRVTVKSFFMGKYPVTQAQWQAVAALPQVNRELEPDPSHFKGKNRPVEQVCWYDAVEFCARLSQQTKWPYRLPSEAEWEYACRAGTTTPFHFGETITTDLANYDGNSTYGSGSKGKYVQETTPVGSFGVANDFGLYDMHGNVWEWCADHWHSNYEDAPTDGSVWEDYNDNDNRNNKRRLLRGGSWFYFPGFCRSGSRYNYNPALRPNLDFIGFRVVCGCAWTL
ncbi:MULTISPECIES: formylglycine-generating enzyme family protein [unclassified Moorena]|uniref:formylglycine-generating enzyme family protein n=1 Tax=unclassified Moorena TaxID=2683338 RepID=UPI0025E6C8EC|nr:MULTISPECIES: formylglycine-generating enzyme family protein [unclassified Moorena]